MLSRDFAQHVYVQVTLKTSISKQSIPICGDEK